MSENLREAYEELLEECRRRGDVLSEAPGREERRDPRVRIHPARLAQRISPWPLAVDISATGMGFLVDEPPAANGPVSIALGDEATAEADVLACDEVPLDALHDPPRYRVRCRFADSTQGLRMLVAIKSMEGSRTTVT